MSQIHTPRCDDWLTVDLERGDPGAWNHVMSAVWVEIDAYLKWIPSCRKEFCELYEEGRDNEFPFVVQIIHILGDDGNGGFRQPDPRKTYDGGLIRKLMDSMSGV